VLAGTAPQGAPKIHRWSDDVYALAARDVPDADHFVKLFFSGSEESRAKGMDFLKRISARQVDPDQQTDLATRNWRRSRAGGSPTRQSSPASRRSPSRHSSPTVITTR
jgi:hypothetical protein